MQSILEIAISPNVALCVKAGFCQIQSHIVFDNVCIHLIFTAIEVFLIYSTRIISIQYVFRS